MTDTELLPAVMSHQDISGFIDSGTFVYFSEFTLYNAAHVANLTLLFIHIYYLHSYSETHIYDDNIQITAYTTLKFVEFLRPHVLPCNAGCSSRGRTPLIQGAQGFRGMDSGSKI